MFNLEFVRRSSFWVGAVALLMLGSAYVARAADAGAEPPGPMPRVVAQEELTFNHQKSGELKALAKDLREVVKLFEALQDDEHPDAEKARERLVKLVGSICKRRRDAGIRKEALLAMADMKHEDCARYIKPFLKPVKKKQKVPPTLLTAIQAAGCVADDALVRPLLKIVEDSDNFAVASHAVAALGKFEHASFKSHKLILQTLGKTLVKNRPGRRSRGKSDPSSGAYIPGKRGSAGGSRWSTLSAAIPAALNELTGQRIRDIEEWMILIKENRRHLKSLFQDRYRD